LAGDEARARGYRPGVLDEFEISTDPARVDVDLVHRWLSTDAYWAIGRAHDAVARSIATSIVYGAYRRDGSQVGFARAVTDSATFAWLCDVYVDRAVRGAGLGTRLVRYARDDLTGTGVSRILLATEDAHGLYAKLAFVALPEPERFMQWRRP
jgi:GNAT superfamily N-acetyltransferase